MEHEISSVFSTFGVCSTRLDPQLEKSVAALGALDELGQVEEMACLQAEVISQRILAMYEEGPRKESDIRGLLTSLARESANAATDPMKRLPAALKQRAAEIRERFGEQLPEWAAEAIRPILVPTPDNVLAAALAAHRLRTDLSVGVPDLRHTLTRQEEAAHNSETVARKICASVETSVLAHTSKSGKRVPPALKQFSAPFGVTLAVALLIKLVTGIDWVAGPAFILAAGAVVGLLAAWRLPLASERAKATQPFAPLQETLVAFAADVAAGEFTRRRLQQSEALLHELQKGAELNNLIESRTAVRRILEAQVNALPERAYSSPSPDLVLLGGRRLVESLWDTRRKGWNMARLSASLWASANCKTVDMVLLQQPSEVAAATLCAATLREMTPVTLAETIEAILAYEGGERSLIGELRSQRTKLAALLPIQERKSQMPPAACPALFHAIVPEGLALKFESVLRVAFTGSALDILCIAGDEFRISFETFNWGNAERAGHRVAAQCLSRYTSLAESEHWSCLKGLTSQAIEPLAPFVLGRNKADQVH